QQHPGRNGKAAARGLHAPRRNGEEHRAQRGLTADGRAAERPAGTRVPSKSAPCGVTTPIPHFASNAGCMIPCVVCADMSGWPAIGVESVRDFSSDSRTGWIAGVPDGVSPVGQDFLQPPSGPGPVTFDKAHPYVDSAISRRTGAQPTLRVADLSNP